MQGGRRAWDCRGGIEQGMSLAGQAFGPGVRNPMAKTESRFVQMAMGRRRRGGATNKRGMGEWLASREGVIPYTICLHGVIRHAALSLLK